MKQAIPILLYHSIRDRPAAGFEEFTVSRAQFADHLDRLLDHGFTPLTVGELVDCSIAGSLPPRPAALTVDDGFVDFATAAWPLLAERGLSATLYVTAGMIDAPAQWLATGGGELRLLSASALRDLAAVGCEIGAHSMTHPHLDCLGHEAAYEEIKDSKDALEQALARPIDTFAYPHGYHSRVTRELVVAAGYRSAAAVRNAFSHSGDDRFALSRLTITADDDSAAVDRMLSGDSVAVRGSRERLRTTLWRQARRLRHSMAASR